MVTPSVCGGLLDQEARALYRISKQKTTIPTLVGHVLEATSPPAGAEAGVRQDVHKHRIGRCSRSHLQERENLTNRAALMNGVWMPRTERMAIYSDCREQRETDAGMKTRHRLGVMRP